MWSSRSRIAVVALLAVLLAAPALATTQGGRQDLIARRSPERSYIDVNAGGPYSGFPHEPMTITVTFEGGINPYHYSMSFGDGTVSTGSTQESTVAFTHTWTEEGDYNLSCSVYDDFGNAGAGGGTVHIAEHPVIVANMGGPYSGAPNETITMTISFEGGVSPYHYHVAFDDGTVQDGSTEESTLVLTHAWAEEGHYSVFCSVGDDHGGMGTGQAEVDIVVTPVAEGSWGRVKALYR